jgi:hypothetical protein
VAPRAPSTSKRRAPCRAFSPSAQTKPRCSQREVASNGQVLRKAKPKAKRQNHNPRAFSPTAQTESRCSQREVASKGQGFTSLRKAKPKAKRQNQKPKGKTKSQNQKPKPKTKNQNQKPKAKTITPSAAQARFTPQQVEDSPATRTSMGFDSAFTPGVMSCTNLEKPSLNSAKRACKIPISRISAHPICENGIISPES